MWSVGVVSGVVRARALLVHLSLCIISMQDIIFHPRANGISLAYFRLLNELVHLAVQDQIILLLILLPAIWPTVNHVYIHYILLYM